MKQVMEGKLWTPKYAEIRLRPCPVPPKKALLIEAVMESLMQLDMDVELGFSNATKAQPNKRWIVDVLSTLDPDHRYLQKDYFPTPEEMRDVEPEDVEKNLIENVDDFFSGLPTNQKFKSKHKGTVFKVKADNGMKFNRKNFKLLLAQQANDDFLAPSNDN